MTSMNQVEMPASAAPQRAPLPQTRESWLARIARHVDSRGWRVLLLLSDIALIQVAFALSYYLRYQLQWFRRVDPAFQVPMMVYAPFAVALTLVLLVAFKLSNVYPYKPGRSLVEETYHIATASTVGVVVLIVVSLAFNPLSYSRLIYLYAAILVTTLVAISRFFIGIGRRHLRRYGVGVRRVLLVGVGDVGRMVMRTIAARPELGYQLVGFLDDHPIKGSTDIGPFKALGPVDNFSQVATQAKIDDAIICLPWQSHRLIQRVMNSCDQIAVRAQVVPDFFQLTRDQMQVESLNGIPLISKRAVSIIGWNYVIKRAFDLIITVVGGLIVLPLVAVIAIAIKFDSPGPVFYAQTRIGRNGRPFLCHKFRSMVDGADQMMHTVVDLNEASGPLFKMKDDPRRTRVGRVLRRFSLDELPQLWNVLAGEMSLIGPRPNLSEEVDKYQEWHRKRLSVSPGITGLWQVSGRSDLTFDEMVLLDIYYVENWSLSFDLGILLRSIPAVLGAKGAY